MKVNSGLPSPLGASLDSYGANFAIFSENATSVDLLLFDSETDEPNARIPLFKTSNVWHVHVSDVRKGQMYAYSMDGPFEPERGLRFNRHKVSD